MTTIVKIAALPRLILAAFVCTLQVGCRDATPPAPAPIAPVAALTGDAKVLRELDHYEPMYKLDSDGRVVRLRLTWRHVPVPVMAEIGKLTELRNLDLYGASISDDGLAQLKDLQKLTNLGLGATPITEKGVAHLAKIESLRYVWLPKHRCEEEAAEKLKRAGVNVYPQ